jgi:hypothetical protein
MAKRTTSRRAPDATYNAPERAEWKREAPGSVAQRTAKQGRRKKNADARSQARDKSAEHHKKDGERKRPPLR